MKNIALRLRYRGTAYHGWQRQKNAISVQETLEEGLRALLGETVKTVGCGRTDAGVHALCYCANFRGSTGIPFDRLPLALNTCLPDDISILAATEAEEDFNAILSCEKKEYTYKILNTRIPDPFLRDLAWFYPSFLDEVIMDRAARMFEGTHDFRAVRSVGTETKTTVRTVHYCQVERQGDLIIMRVCADGFLYNMARTIAGTLVYAALGKIEPDEIPVLLEKGDRRLTGPTVPPEGLYLSKIWYGGEVGKMMR